MGYIRRTFPRGITEEEKHHLDQRCLRRSDTHQTRAVAPLERLEKQASAASARGTACTIEAAEHLNRRRHVWHCADTSPKPAPRTMGGEVGGATCTF